MISGIVREYYCGIFGYRSKHYIFKEYYLRVSYPFNLGFTTNGNEPPIRRLQYQYGLVNVSLNFRLFPLLRQIYIA